MNANQAYLRAYYVTHAINIHHDAGRYNANEFQESIITKFVFRHTAPPLEFVEHVLKEFDTRTVDNLVAVTLAGQVAPTLDTTADNKCPADTPNEQLPDQLLTTLGVLGV